MDAEPFGFEGAAPLRPVVDQALRRVIDPEMALNIVDVGLVYQVTLEDSRACVSMTMTSPACPVSELIVHEVARELEWVLGPDIAVDVDVVWNPAWTPARMSQQARHIMGWS